MLETDARVALIRDWLARDLRLPVLRIEPASSDASFRRYFRVFCDAGTYVVMDAPPGKEDVRPYLKVSQLLESLGAHVPHVHESDAQRGLLLLEDLGATLYLERLVAGDDPEPLYADALRVLALIQVRGREACAQLAPYGRAELAREMGLMPEWFLARHLALTPSADEARLLGAAFEFLIQEALAQPVVFVHRDYHARNLMVVRERNPGILDFQDALRGPVAYDLASLLKDCYIAWPRERVVHWVSGHRAQLRAQGGDAGASAAICPTCRARSTMCATPVRATASSARLALSSSSASWRSCRAPTRRSGTHEGDAAGGRPRRAHATDHRFDAEAPGAGGRQAAHCLAPRGTGARRHPRGGHQPLVAGRPGARDARRRSRLWCVDYLQR